MSVVTLHIAREGWDSVRSALLATGRASVESRVESFAEFFILRYLEGDMY